MLLPRFLRDACKLYSHWYVHTCVRFLFRLRPYIGLAYDRWGWLDLTWPWYRWELVWNLLWFVLETGVSPIHHWIQRVLHWQPVGQRRLGRPKLCWESKLEMYWRYQGLVHWAVAAQNCEFWKQHLNTFFDFCCPWACNVCKVKRLRPEGGRRKAYRPDPTHWLTLLRSGTLEYGVVPSTSLSQGMVGSTHFCPLQIYFVIYFVRSLPRARWHMGRESQWR